MSDLYPQRYVDALNSEIRALKIELYNVKESAIPALKAAYAQGQKCDLGEKCAGCMAGYALEYITGRSWTQEECGVITHRHGCTITTPTNLLT